MLYIAEINKVLKKVPKHIWILLVIITIGIFLRTYNFHDWLRFSMDQSRDAFIISNAIEGKEKLPLLGPVAGGTGFHLGPAYYYFSFLSVKIFGNYPDKMAYPSLFFSILAIPLTYLFFREYFKKNISLILVAIMSVSYFFIEASRFSSNPNLTPFFVVLLLYSLLKIINGSDKLSWRWPILAGISLGVGIQLHTTLLVIMPIFSLILFFYLLKKRGLTYLKYILVIVVISLIANAFQIYGEFQTGGNNVKNFFIGLTDTRGKESSLVKNVATVFICQAKSNTHIIFSLPVTEACSKKIETNIKKGSKELYGEIKDRALRKTAYFLNIFSIFIFFIFSYALFIFKYLKEKEEKKKNCLRIIGLFNVVTLLFLVPVISSIKIEYFIIICFIPLLLFGLTLQFFQEKLGKYGKMLAIFLVIITSAFLLKTDLEKASFYEKKLDNNLENSNLKWAENSGIFFMQANLNSKIVYVSGEKKYLDRFAGPISYMLSRQEVEVVEINIKQIEKNLSIIEELVYIKNSGSKDIGEYDSPFSGYKIIDKKRLRPVDIFILKNNQ